MEVERALADLQEVRDRLAACQQFRGYSGPAAAASGAVAILAGAVQFFLVPAPTSAADERTYLIIWFACLAFALLLNYGALWIWYVRTVGRQERSGARSAGVTLLPAVALGAVLSLALILRGSVGLLPGIWYACYAVGLVASRSMVPKGTGMLAAAFGIGGTLLLLWPSNTLPLAWWVMPLGFGAGQIYIGWLLAREGAVEVAA